MSRKQKAIQRAFISVVGSQLRGRVGFLESAPDVPIAGIADGQAFREDAGSQVRP